MSEHRQIAIESIAQKHLEEIYGGSEIADEVTAGFFGILARVPELGTQITPRVWKMEMAKCGIIKGVVVYYTFDDHEVEVLEFHVID